MLDIEETVAASESALKVVPLAEMKRHLRIRPTNTAHDETLTDAIKEAVEKLHGLDGELNRTILPVTWKRYLSKFPDLVVGKSRYAGKGAILLPMPPLIEVLAVSIEDGDSPTTQVDPDSYVIKSGTMIPEIHPVDDWPSVLAAPRAISVTYRAGYTAYPLILKRMVKILAAHYFENAEATINEQRVLQINRAVEFGMADLRAALRVPLSYDDWNE